MPDDFELAAEDPESLSEEIPEPSGGLDIDEFTTAPDDVRPEPAAKAEEVPAAEPWQQFAQAGETPQQALERIAKERDHERGKAGAFYSDLKTLKDELAGLRQENQAAQRLYERFRRLDEEAARRAWEEMQPDPELEPEKAALAEVRALRQQLTTEAETRRIAEQEERQAEQFNQVQREWEQLDNWTANEIAAKLGQYEGIEEDPQFKADFDTVERYRWNMLSAQYPDATDDQKLEAVTRLRIIQGRQCAVQKKHPSQFYQEMAQVVRSSAGAVAAPVNGNGRPSPAQVEAAARRATRGGGVRRIGGRSSTAPPQSLSDFASLSEEDQARVLDESEVSEEALWGALADDFGG